MKTTPPILPRKLLNWLLKEELAEEVLGDLEENFLKATKNHSVFRAKINYWYQALNYIRPFAIKDEWSNSLTTLMIQHNLKFAFRRIKTDKSTFLINSVGLIIAFATALVIYLYVSYEFSFDKFYPDSDRMFKMISTNTSAADAHTSAITPYSFTEVIGNEFPQVEASTYLAGPFDSQLLFYDDNSGNRVKTVENKVVLADSGFFKVFNINILHGNAAKCLSQPNQVVLTESAAIKFYGTTNVVGRTIYPAGKLSVITAVCEDLPTNSHLQFNYLVSASTVAWLSKADFNLASAHCYFKFTNTEAAHEVQNQLPQLVRDYLLKAETNTNEVKYSFVQVPRLHLHPENLSGFTAGGNGQTLYFLSAVGFLVIFIALINFTNLTVTRSDERLREIGIKKVLGSRRPQLMAQLLLESMIPAILCALFALLLVYQTIPIINNLIDIQLSFILSVENCMIILSLALLLGLIAGLYPAIRLISGKPIHNLKGKTLLSSRGKTYRTGLITFQFCISAILIVMSLVIYRQSEFLTQKDLGFKKDNLMVIEGVFHSNPSFSQPFLDRLRLKAGVKNAAGTLWVQGFQGTWTDRVHVPGGDEDIELDRILIGDDYLETLQIDVIDGRGFSEESKDGQSVLLNEAAVARLGLEEPINSTVKVKMDDHDYLELQVVGIVKNFNYNSLYHDVEPLMLMSNESNQGRMKYIIANLDADDIGSTIAEIETLWNELIPDRAFRFEFLDKTLDGAYREARSTSKLLSMFTFIAVIISCLGLYAISAYTAKLRLREFSIRKVFGASGVSVARLMLKEYVVIYAWAILIALPISLWLANYWLEKFAYRVQGNFSYILTTCLALLAIVMVTVLKHIIQTSQTSVMDTLKNES